MCRKNNLNLRQSAKCTTPGERKNVHKWGGEKMRRKLEECAKSPEKKMRNRKKNEQKMYQIRWNVHQQEKKYEGKCAKLRGMCAKKRKNMRNNVKEKNMRNSMKKKYAKPMGKKAKTRKICATA